MSRARVFVSGIVVGACVIYAIACVAETPWALPILAFQLWCLKRLFRLCRLSDEAEREDHRDELGDMVTGLLTRIVRGVLEGLRSDSPAEVRRGWHRHLDGMLEQMLRQAPEQEPFHRWVHSLSIEAVDRTVADADLHGRRN